MRGFLILLLCCFAPICVIDVGAQEKADSVLNTAESHYEQGMKLFERGDLDDALKEFHQTVKLDADYPGGYIGLAYIHTTRGEFDSAKRYLKVARKKDKKGGEVYLAEGRILVKKQGKNWLKDALKAFKNARKRHERDDRIPYYEGEAYRLAGQYQEAENAFSKAIDLKGSMTDRAVRALETVQMTRRAAPGTDVGIKIARLDPLTRADLAALLIDEMKLEELVKKKTEQKYNVVFRTPDESASEMTTGEASDIKGHWAKAWIEQTLPLKVPGLGVYPDGTFKPYAAVARKDFALVIQGLLVLITGDASLTTAYLGAESSFQDVRPDVFYFNATTLAVNRGLMQIDKLKGTFRPNDPVSGAEALLTIKDLKSALVTR
jgi:tetratricopeptide (TPR) repeat protein